MNDRDQKLLWESYMESKSEDTGHDKKEHSDKDEEKKGKHDDGDGKTEKCDFVPCKEGTDGKTDDLTEKEKFKFAAHAAKQGKGPLADKDKSDDTDEKDVKEEMNNMEFSAIGRETPEQLVFDAVLSWMRADTEGLVTPEDMEGYSMSTAFDDAKDFIKQALQDISFSEVKAHMNSTVDMGAGYNDPEEMAFQQSVDDDVRLDDSRLSDMPPRQPGV